MWFKNLTLFKFSQAFTLNGIELADKLAETAFRPCLSQEMNSMGWAPPLGRKAVDLVHSANGCLLLRLQSEDKLLPPAVVNEIVDDKVFAIEEREGRKIRRREREQMRDEVMLELLPRAFTRSRDSYAYIDPRGGWLVIDSVSRKAVDEFTGLLRKSLGSLAIAPPQVNTAPDRVMTGWLTGENRPPDVELGDECELRDDTEEGGVVRCRGQDLDGAEIGAHLQAGKRVTRLSLAWNQRLSLVLADDLSIRRLRFLDLVQEQLDGVETDSDEALFDAQFVLMTGELGLFLQRLMEWWGGEAD